MPAVDLQAVQSKSSWTMKLLLLLLLYFIIILFMSIYKFEKI